VCSSWESTINSADADIPSQALMRRAFLTVLACAVALLLSACTDFSTTELDASDAEAMRYARTGDLKAEVDSLMQPLIDRGVTPGAIVGVRLPDGSTRYYGYGTAEPGRAAKPNRDTLFAVGSLSKGVLGAITAMLVQQGRISWADTLETLLPAGTKLSADARKITVLQLATHTSGLPRQPFTGRMLGPFLRYLFTGESFYDMLDRRYLFDYLANFVAPSHPEYQYSNIGYGILGYALTQRTGLSLDALLQQEIAGPLGLRNTAYAAERLPGYATRARGTAGDEPKFIVRGEPIPDWRFTDIMQGGTALYSTAEDMLIFAASYLKGNGERRAAMADSLRIRFARPKESSAIAWTIDDLAGDRIAHEIGIVAGYTSYLGLDVTHRTAVVVLQNTFNWDESVGSRLLIRLAHAQDRWKDGPPVRDARTSSTGPAATR
jgi:CubicO group peptidase (beta-lactamase class C family)